MMKVDLWRAANLLIEHYRENAGIHAAKLADKLADEGDEAGAKAWRSIVKAIDTLLHTTPDDRSP
jgi:hypothetical protein